MKKLRLVLEKRWKTAYNSYVEHRRDEKLSMENKQELFEKAPVWKAYFIISLPVVFSMLVTLSTTWSIRFSLPGRKMPTSLRACRNARRFSR